MTGHFPNIELIEYIFQQQVLSRLDAGERYIPDVDAYVFPQTWPNTGGGLAEPGYVYGQAITKQYTTVIVSHNHNMAMVAFGNKPAYIVDDLNEKFMSDLRTQNMAGKYDSQTRY